MDYHAPWYHGSPVELEILRTGSTITQWRELARVFSHKPIVVSVSGDHEIQHNGTRPGFLYEIAEPIAPEDVEQHPRTTMDPGDEWLTHRELRLRLIGKTTVRPEEYLSDGDIARLKAQASSDS
jgi:hypothetical protein